MATVKLMDVITRAHSKVDKDNTDLIYYVGGEHFETENPVVEDRGLIAGSTIGPMFYYGFMAGQFLLVSRNPHLRKAGVAHFDGICSEKTFVLESKNPEILLPDFLPFILQNERFWKYAIDHKHGSTNFFLNWGDLSQYTFDLPSLNEQKRIANALWALVNTQKSYKKLLKKTDNLVKSQFIEMFGDLSRSAKYPTVELGSISEMISGGTPSSKYPEYFGGKIPFVTTPCLGANYIDAKDAQNWLTELGVENSSTHMVPAYSLMIGNRVGVGKSSINTCEMCTNQDILSFVGVDTEKYDLLFLKKVIEQYVPFFESQKRGATIKGIPSDLVKASKIPQAPMDIQRQFVDFVRQSDKSKFELEQSLAELTATYKRIISENLG